MTFFIDLGWFKGEKLGLLELSLFENYGHGQGLRILRIKIIKFLVEIGV